MILENQILINGNFDKVLEITSSDPNISKHQLLRYAAKSANSTLPKGLLAKVADDAEQCYIKDEDGTRMQIGFDLFNK